MSFLLRPMTTTDYGPVSSLWSASEGVGICGPFEQFQSYLQRNPGLSPVACDEDRIIGALHCGHDGFRGYLYQLAVAEDRRGWGVGRAMVDWSLQKLEGLGIQRCTLFVYRDHPAGESFWKHLQWRERTDLIVLAKDLPTN